MKPLYYTEYAFFKENFVQTSSVSLTIYRYTQKVFPISIYYTSGIHNIEIFKANETLYSLHLKLWRAHWLNGSFYGWTNVKITGTFLKKSVTFSSFCNPQKAFWMVKNPENRIRRTYLRHRKCFLFLCCFRHKNKRKLIFIQ